MCSTSFIVLQEGDAMAVRRLSSVAASGSSDLSENDDKAEKEERRSSRVSSASTSSNGSNSVNHLSQKEVELQMHQVLKLNAEDKINDKNAFQLKMIDFLVYALKKEELQLLSNLQMASACLDASGKIYGHRVDKVHSDLLKIVGASRGQKRPHENEEDQDVNVISRPKKKRKRTHIVLSTPQGLRGNIETYNPLSLINGLEKLTSDRLFLAGFPLHTNQGVSISQYNDVLLDRVLVSRSTLSNFNIPQVSDISENQLCPAYQDFKFLGWSVDDEPVDDTFDQNESEGDYHFDMNEPVVDDQSNSMLDYRDNLEERCDITANQDQHLLTDYQEIIANDQDPNCSLEYTYIEENLHSINFVRPAHWQVRIKKDMRFNGATRSVKKATQKYDIELEWTKDDKEDAETRFALVDKTFKLAKNAHDNWSEDQNNLPLFNNYNKNRFSSYFTNDRVVKLNDENAKCEKEEDMRDSDEHVFDLSTVGNEHHNEGWELRFIDGEESQMLNDSFVFPDSEPPSQPPCQEQAFQGQNLVSLPKLTQHIFIPHSQRAKKIDMRQLKKSVMKSLEHRRTKEFSELYRELPLRLSKANSKSLSPALAFVSLLHVSHENTLSLQNYANYEDLSIQKLCNKVQE